MSEELKPVACPFCGGEPHVTRAVGEVWVRCSQCNSSNGLSTADEAKAIAAWNRRALPAGWISVEDRLPEANINVLVYDGDYGIGSLSKRTKREPMLWWLRWQGLDGDDDFSHDVTHWQPLPAAPE